MSLHVDIKKKLASFTLEVAFDAEDETLGFLGESGCGKSMTLRCIAGIETPDEGVIQVNGRTYFDSAAKVNLSAQQRKTALLFQNYMLFPNMTVAQNVAAGIDKNVAAADRRAIVARELERFGLTGFEKRYPLQLSGGQQQRVALARMLAAHPGILMLDEPFSALDAHLKDYLSVNLTNLFDAFSGTILYVSHDIDEAVRFCDRIAVVDAGHIKEVGTTGDVVNHPRSEAGLKLSGVKNVTEVERVDAHTLRAPRWGVTLHLERAVPEGVKMAGVRAFYLERAEGPGRNCYHMQVESASDARFDRRLTLRFLEREAGADAPVEPGQNEMRALHQVLTWRLSKLDRPESELPRVGERLWIRIPEEKLYLVDR